MHAVFNPEAHTDHKTVMFTAACSNLYCLPSAHSSAQSPEQLQSLYPFVAQRPSVLIGVNSDYRQRAAATSQPE